MKLFALSSQNLSFGGKLKILVLGPSRIQRFSMLLNTTEQHQTCLYYSEPLQTYLGVPGTC